MASKQEKLIKEIGGLTVLELAELVKGLEKKFGVSAAMPMMAAACGSSRRCRSRCCKGRRKI